MLAAVSTADFVDRLVNGENLEILQRFITDETVDLVYLDPPFGTRA
jgi:16S rRNA G966 N2-methylase RsmD